MKKILPLFFTLFLSGVFLISCAQEKEKKKVKKEIQVEQENGATTVTITETEEGKVTKRVLTGEDAEEYLEENDGSGENSFYFSGDDEEGNRVVVIEEIDTDDDGNHHVWVTDGGDSQMKMIMTKNGIEEDVEKLLEDFDGLKKDEIKIRLEEMMRDFEKMEKEMVVSMESIHKMDDNVKVNVVEKNGVVIIEKTVDGKTTVETINVDDEKMSGNNIYIIKSKGDGGEEETIITKTTGSGQNETMNMNVYPNPNKGSFNIELDLNSEKEATVNVVDMDGKDVYNKVIKGEKDYKLNVNVKNSKKGMFIVTVKQGETVMKSKIMID